MNGEDESLPIWPINEIGDQQSKRKQMFKNKKCFQNPFRIIGPIFGLVA